MIGTILVLLGLTSALPVTDNVIVHASVPGYKLNFVDPSSLGLDKVRQEAGYLNTPLGDRLFYWFFESRSNPSADPVVLWLNGGPGCSSLEAVLFENGPMNMDSNGQLKNNTWSWNNHANMLFIDNPSGVGYSKGGHTVTDTVTASEDLKSAIKLFFTQNPQFQKNGFHIAGESYAGRYIPVFATAINEWSESPVKVQSVLIGNGLVSPTAEYASYEPMLCGQGGYSAILSPNECRNLQRETPGCVNAMTQCENSLGAQCFYAQYSCSSLQSSFSNKNPYDIRDASCAETQTGLCYPGLDAVQNYFNDPTVRKALGVDDGSGSSSYQICNNQINAQFYRNRDPFAPTFRNVTALLEAGTGVLVYNGGADIILNWLGGRQWTSDLQWSGQSGFQQAARSPVDWTPAHSQKRGEVTNFGKFTFLRVLDAGHMVPHDQPESAHYMLLSWLKGDHAFRKTYS